MPRTYSASNAGLLVVRSHPESLYKKLNRLLNTIFIIKAKTSYMSSGWLRKTVRKTEVTLERVSHVGGRISAES